MSLAQQVSALRAFFGTPADAPLYVPSVEAMNLAMGIIGEGPLPAQVAALVLATGINMDCAHHASSGQAQPQPQPQPQPQMPSAGPMPASRPASAAAAEQPPVQRLPARPSQQSALP